MNTSTPQATTQASDHAPTTSTGEREALINQLRSARGQRARQRRIIIAILGLLVLAVVIASLCLGQTNYSPAQVWQVILGHKVPGASFTVGTLRLPRTAIALVAGLSFGLAGVSFQTLLRNPLASPDVIGISTGASAAAAFAIVILSLSGTVVSVFAIVAGLLIATLIYLLSYKGGAAGTRLILVGIGVAAMLESLISWVLTQAGQWDLQEATRWLTGSLNGSTWAETLPALIALGILGPLLLSQTRYLDSLQMGDDTAAAMGTRVERTRILVIMAAVGLISFATAATGPIAFVAFLSGPIASRLIGARGSKLIPAALIGALLVLVADFAGQYLLGTRFPVGVITGVLGAPYLIYLIIRTNRAGGSL
ncbi:FecCD family ABC transporter permease [Glutamicibacter mishrai]|uniref:FecCD family ABC transporter permease n=1 Tax=Glutamicibacter mishrai TaxID=1775880 RepID=UPI003CCDB022